MNEKFCILIWIWMRVVPKGPIDNESALVQMMAWCQTGEKPLFEPMMTQFTDAYIRLGRVNTIYWYISPAIDINWISEIVFNIFMGQRNVIDKQFESTLYSKFNTLYIYYTSASTFTHSQMMFLTLDSLWDYRIELVAMGLPCIVFTFPTKIFCQGVSGFVNGFVVFAAAD